MDNWSQESVTTCVMIGIRSFHIPVRIKRAHVIYFIVQNAHSNTCKHDARKLLLCHAGQQPRLITYFACQWWYCIEYKRPNSHVSVTIRSNTRGHPATPKVRYSEGPILRRFITPKVRHSEIFSIL